MPEAYEMQQLEPRHTATIRLADRGDVGEALGKLLPDPTRPRTGPICPLAG